MTDKSCDTCINKDKKKNTGKWFPLDSCDICSRKYRDNYEEKEANSYWWIEEAGLRDGNILTVADCIRINECFQKRIKESLGEAIAEINKQREVPYNQLHYFEKAFDWRK